MAPLKLPDVSLLFFTTRTKVPFSLPSRLPRRICAARFFRVLITGFFITEAFGFLSVLAFGLVNFFSLGFLKVDLHLLANDALVLGLVNLDLAYRKEQ